MKIILCEKLPRILKNKRRLEKILKVKITNRNTEITIQGQPEQEYIAEKVIEALNFGFPYINALELADGENIFEIITIKDHTVRKDLPTIKARIIGKKGKTLQTLCQLTKCHFEIKDNTIGIIGGPEHIESAQKAIISIIKGSKQGNVYAHLEKHQVKDPIDLGIKK